MLNFSPSCFLFFFFFFFLLKIHKYHDDVKAGVKGDVKVDDEFSGERERAEREKKNRKDDNDFASLSLRRLEATSVTRARETT